MEQQNKKFSSYIFFLFSEQIWRTDLDFMITHRDRLFILSFVTSPYQNISTAELPFNATLEHKFSQQPRPYYDTHLVERFRPELDNFDNENSYEKLEMEETNANNENDDMDDDDENGEMNESNEDDEFYIPPTTAKTPPPSTTHPTLLVPKISSTSKIKSTKTLPTIALKTTQQTSTSTITDVPLALLTTSTKKEKTPKSNNYNTNSNSNNHKNQSNRHHQNNGHKKQNHRNHDNKGQTSANSNTNNSKKRKETITHDVDEEFDDHLELKPEKEFNFNFDDVASTKLIDFNKPLAPPLPSSPSSTLQHSNNRKSNNKKSSSSSSSNTRTTNTPMKESETRKESSNRNTQPPPTIQSTSVSASADSKIIEIKSTPKNAVPSSSTSSSSSLTNIRKTRSYQHEFEVNEDDFIVRSIRPEIVVDDDIEYLRENRERILESGEDVDGNFMIIEPSALIGSSPGRNISKNHQLTGIGGVLQKFLHTKDLEVAKWTTPPSLEFLNFALAIMVWSVRYPSVFWKTSKSFAAIFSLQLIANGFDILVGFAGMSVLYKIQITGQALPLNSPNLILNAVVTISLYIFSTILIIASSMILYLYGHGRLVAKIRDRSMISIKSADNWIYFAHCASLSFVLALSVVKAPLMHDLSAAYRGSLDGAVLTAGKIFTLVLSPN